MSYKTEDIRNVVLGGHGGVGKTTLLESILFKAGVIKRKGSVQEKNTVSDFDPDEKERGHSIYASVCHFNHKEKLINIIDTPGFIDFFGAAIGPFYVSDFAIIVIDANKGVEVNTRKFWQLADECKLPRIIVLNKIEGEYVKLNKLLEELNEDFQTRCLLYAIPDEEGTGVSKVTPFYEEGVDESLATEFIESLVEQDDELLEKYLEGETISKEELFSLLKKAIIERTFVPVIPISVQKDIGIDLLMDFIADFAPNPLEIERFGVKNGELIKLEHDPNGPVVAQSFKVMIDPYIGKINFVRVFNGTLKGMTSYYLSSTQRTEKIGQVVKYQGKENINVNQLIPGDIGAILKIENLNTGDYICTPNQIIELKPIPFPTPMISLAVEPQQRSDEQKITGALKKLADEDPTFRAEWNRQTKELVISGIGPVHLEVMLNKLKSRYGVKVNTRQPKIAYMETITGKAESRYRHKKQTGGAGQFAEVAIRIEPNERGGGFKFLDEIVGGVIPNQFIPSVEKGIANIMEEGILAGYPVTDVVVHLWDGKTHPVDSKDIAFQIAGREAFKKAFQDAKPTFLEPIGIIEVTVPANLVGDIISDLNTRRAKILGTEAAGKYQIVKAEVPLAEVANYTNDLRSMTGGEGTYTLKFSHYDLVPAHIREKILKEAKKDKE